MRLYYTERKPYFIFIYLLGRQPFSWMDVGCRVSCLHILWWCVGSHLVPVKLSSKFIGNTWKSIHWEHYLIIQSVDNIYKLDDYWHAMGCPNLRHRQSILALHLDPMTKIVWMSLHGCPFRSQGLASPPPLKKIAPPRLRTKLWEHACNLEQLK